MVLPGIALLSKLTCYGVIYGLQEPNGVPPRLRIVVCRNKVLHRRHALNLHSRLVVASH